MNRRYFLMAPAASALAARSRAIASPNDTVRVACVGLRGQGRSHIRAYSALPNVEIAALCDVDESILDQQLGRVEKSGKKRPARFTDFRKLLEDKSIDANSIATPNHTHALISIAGCQAGKDVYVEKPLTLFVREGRWMIDVAKRYKRVVQVGVQNRAGPNFQRAREFIRQGKLGDIVAVQDTYCRNLMPGFGNPPDQEPPKELDWDKWLGQVEPKPFNENIRISRSRPGWLSIKDFCGGEICGWGSHDLDQVQWALGMDESGPTEVWVEGQPYKPWIAEDGSRAGRFFGAKETIIHMMYPGGIHLELSENANPNGGALFIGEKGQIRIDRGRFTVSDPGWKTISLEGMPVQLYTARNHYRNFVDCIKERKKCVCDVETGHRSATVCHLGNIARWVSQQTQTVGTRLIWDPVKEQFKDNALANSMLDRPRRKGYELPKV